ncbi:condensation domain-containing protein [Mycobacterium ostraviense]|uniref:Condensation domain-containing protein n=1 Tax=Mycobacterium ostraviense TaxID=2738409 RepID=A0A164BHP1_9MYCO|nr:condensation domain-containing protein [Mycobacterium ostraviense]KZS63500.1 hypothetical protein A4G28_09930 [Mycobacterium ostraviense]UGT92066.1 condensation domain-containing protein [Mycobacterium ostraviense]
MFFKGTVDDWAPEGFIISWLPTEASYALARQAPIDEVPASYQQRRHLRVYREQKALGRDIPRLLIFAWDVQGVCDVEFMTHALNTHIRRHDTYRSWFAFNEDDYIVRRTIKDSEALALEFRPVDRGPMTPLEARQMLLDTPDPLQWDCFRFGVIQREDSFTIYAAVDHLHIDGMSFPTIIFELYMAYVMALQGAPTVLPESGSYRNYCATQQAHTASLTSESPQVRAWYRFIEQVGGALPSFPLPLGEVTDEMNGAMDVLELMDEGQGQRFEVACRAVGGRFWAGVFAAAALAERELTGAETYFGITPLANRMALTAVSSVGWFASLVPLVIPTANSTFEEVLLLAQESLNGSRTLGEVPFDHLLEMKPSVPGPIFADKAVPLLSFIDFRRHPATNMAGISNIGLWGDHRLADEIRMWVGVMPDRTQLVISYPDNPIARDSVYRYADAMKAVLVRVADRILDGAVSEGSSS